MSYPVVDLEEMPVMAPRFRRHMDPEPVCPQDAECPGPHSISCQDIKTVVPIQGVVGLVQVEEYGMEYCLPHEN